MTRIALLCLLLSGCSAFLPVVAPAVIASTSFAAGQVLAAHMTDSIETKGDKRP